MDIQQRIAQFEKMASADPDNDMAHFSLGNAYYHAQQFEQAAASFRRCTNLNPIMSKAYQLGGESLVKTDQIEAATRYLTTGYRAAAGHGDRMPMEAMGELLESIGAPLPIVEEPISTEETPAGTFRCERTGKLGTQLDKPPFRGPLGEHIHATISAETWHAWISLGTKLINELRLDFSREEDQRTYDQHMIEYLGLEEVAAKFKT